MIRALQATIVICIEFIITTLQHSPLPTEFSILPKDQETMMAATTMPTGEPVERRGIGPWSVVLWTDDKHVLRENTRQIRDALGVSWDEAEVLAKQTDELVSALTQPS
jgi:E3 ubiquitin-protein ligase UBR1